MGAFLAIIAIICIIIGIIGTVVPLIPGVPIAFLAVLLYGWYEGFVQISPYYLAVIGTLAALSLVIDYVIMAWGSKLFGATTKSAIGAVIGAILGIFIFPPFGIIIFAVLGAFAVEWYLTKNPVQAIKAGIGSALGFFSSILFKFMLGVAILVTFIIRII